MWLLRTWSSYFQGYVRQRGRAYYAAGHIKQVAPEDGELFRAQANGARNYQVTIRSNPSGAAADCTCPLFATGSYCKHIWATLLAISENAQEDLPAVLFDQMNPAPPKARKRATDRNRSGTIEPSWIGQLSLMRPIASEPKNPIQPIIPIRWQVFYSIDWHQSIQHQSLVVKLGKRKLGHKGSTSLKPLKIQTDNLSDLADPIDHQLCALICGATGLDTQATTSNYRRPLQVHSLPRGAWRAMLKRMVQTGRCLFDSQEQPSQPSTPIETWDGDQPWQLWMTGQLLDEQLTISLELRRNQQRMDINEPLLVLGGDDGLVIYDHMAAPLDDGGATHWLTRSRDTAKAHDEASKINVPRDDIPKFLERLFLLPQVPLIDLPDEIGLMIQHVKPVPQLDLLVPVDPKRPGKQADSQNYLTANVCFRYNQYRIKPDQTRRFICQTNEPGSKPPTDEQALENNANLKTPPPDTHDTPANPIDPKRPLSSAIPLVAIHRDLRAEQQAMDTLPLVGFTDRPADEKAADSPGLRLPTEQMPYAVGQLIQQGWEITTNQCDIAQPTATHLSVTSGIDWFDLHGSWQYETQSGPENITLPDILRAAQAGQAMIRLSDGSHGLLPLDWLNQNQLLTTVGKLDTDHLRFDVSQAAILDILLKDQPLVDIDARFEQVRQKLNGFNGIDPIPEAPTFHGDLRPYQQQGLGWLEFLRWMGVGGVLADDMGLGKTIQVLAMLDALYASPEAQDNPTDPIEDDRHTHRPTLIVVPRSVVFNWIDEAQRFAPNLRVQPYTAGGDRQTLREAFIDHDVIVTSYGLMRRDIVELRQHEFEYVVLDEAQAIKNPASQSAKAARLLDARCRLALTGTPVENHLGDLWSIFEFLNQGMLGSGTRFAKIIRSMTRKNRHRPSIQGLNLNPADDAPPSVDALPPAKSEHEGITQITRALQPFILRRTKSQVLDDLPEKTEQTIACQMEPAQRQTYDQLLKYYRHALVQQMEAPTQDGASTGKGLGGSTMVVLEALLRLRQAACHPGLIDPARSDEPSAKLDVLMDRVDDLIEEGHKALLFSQFTSMLSIVRNRLDQRQINYEYLDGQTRDRKQRVDHFQNSDDCQLFLISLKAGGLGLNLTAASYVFILDPWWNPAVEAQAIDRAHRIGQTQHVFAYRLICQDTIEERIAQLQDKKRKLADAIIGGHESLLRSMTREDLQWLLS